MKRFIFISFLLALISCGKAMPDLGSLPSFQLQRQDGQLVRLEDLKGSVWIADFIYTGCGSTCPMLTQKMKELQERLQAISHSNIRLVSITVDPENDTLERLKDYADRFGATPDQWLFLTGPTDEIQRVVSEGFKLAFGKEEEIFHSNKLVLVDSQGKIRGYFEADDAGINHLVRGLEQLSREEKRS